MREILHTKTKKSYIKNDIFLVYNGLIFVLGFVFKKFIFFIHYLLLKINSTTVQVKLMESYLNVINYCVIKINSFPSNQDL